MPAWAEFLLSGICHRIPEHALSYGGQVSSLCARCTGMFCGALFIALLVVAIEGWPGPGRLPPSMVGLIAGLFVWWALDGLNGLAFEVLGRPVLYEPGNVVRLFTGLGVGMSAAVVLWTVATQAFAPPEMVERAWEPARVVGLLIAVGLLGLLLLSDALPWALVAGWSALGIVALLGGANALLVALVWNRRAVLAVPGGITLALLEMVTLATVRRLIGA